MREAKGEPIEQDRSGRAPVPGRASPGAGLSRRTPRGRLGDLGRQTRRLHSRTRQGRSGAVRYRHRDGRRPGVRGGGRGRLLHHPVRLEALHVRLRAPASRTACRARSGGRRADGGSVQLDRARRGRQPPVQPHGQCRGYRRRRDDARRHTRGAHHQHGARSRSTRPCSTRSSPPATATAPSPI